MAGVGDLSGSALPVYIPLITDIANIQNGLRNFYYGVPSAVADEGSIEPNSIAGRIKDLRDTKLNVASPSATTQLTISEASLPKLILQRGANTTTIQNNTASNITLTLPSSTGTIALTTESAMANLGTVGSSVSTLTLGGSTTTTYSIGTSALSSGTKTINVGAASDTTTKNINIGTGSSSSTTTVTIGTNSGGTSVLNTYGTLTHTGAATVTGNVTGASFVIGSSTAPTITKGSVDPTGTPQTGSLYIKTGVAYDDTLWSYSTSGWRKMRGNKWFSGTGAPGTLTGQQVGDFYLDRTTGKVYELA